MKVVNDSLKNSLKKPTTQRKGRILVGENYYEVYNVKYYADAYNEGNVIGNATASQLDFEMPYIEKFNTFKYFDGVWNGNSYEYVDFGTFTVFDEKDEDDFNKHITAFDNLIKFNAPFNDIGGYPKTLFQELQNVCNQAGVNLKNMSITNGNFKVENNQFVNGESLKTVLKQICSISGNYAIIKDDMLVLQLKNNTNEIIDKSQHEPVDWKRRTYGINQVIIGISNVEGEYVIRQDEQDIAQNGVHKLVINDNLFAYTQSKRDELIDELFNQVRGFGYIPYEMNCEWLNYLDVGDTITVDDIETIILRIEGSSPKSLESKISAPAIIDSSIEYLDNTNDVKNQLKRTEIIVDKQNQSIESVVSQTNEQNQKIAQVTQTVEELNSKISDIADITTSAEDTDAKIEINEVNQSEPIRLVVRPIGKSISNLLISSNMLISDNLKLKQRIIRFTNVNTNEIFDYELPDNLIYHDSENYDEFILDYDGQSCVINKKVGYNVNGTTYILENPTTIEYAYPAGNNAIVLTDGNYKVEILGYDTGYIFARLMAKNIYTTQFYTKAETDSIISQTSQSIDLSVNSKLNNYSTTTQMNSAIQLSALNITSNVSNTYATKNELNTTEKTLNSKIEQTASSITAEVSSTYSTKNETTEAKNDAISSANESTDNKLKNYSTTNEVNNQINKLEEETKASLELKIDKNDNNRIVSMINASADEININGKKISLANFKITDDKLTSEIKPDYNFTQEDVEKIRNYIMGTVALTPEELIKYDVTKNGTISAQDYVIIKQMVNSGISNDKPGKFEIDTAPESTNIINFYNGLGELAYYIGYWISKFNYLECQTLNVNKNLTVGNIDNGICTLNSSDVLWVDFNKTFDNIPNVVISPYTEISGVIVPKIRTITNTGFEATIGGSGFSNIQCCWIAVS